jgi:hypothetical protein
LIEDLRFLGNSEEYTRILQGNYILPEDLDLISKEFIKELKKLPGLIDQPKVVISIKLFCDRWRKISEKTLAGISRIYFSHMKVCIQSNAITDFEATISYIPFAT